MGREEDCKRAGGKMKFVDCGVFGADEFGRWMGVNEIERVTGAVE